MTSQENSRMHRIAELISALGPYGEPVIEALLLEYFRAQKKTPGLAARCCSRLCHFERGSRRTDPSRP